MSVDTTTAALESAAERLQGGARELARQIEVAALELRATGRPVDATLLSELTSFGSRLRDWETAAATLVGRNTLLDETTPRSWRGLIDAYRSASERRSHIARLEPLAGLRHLDPSQHGLLAACKTAASKLMQALASESRSDWLDVERTELVAETHPLLAVSRLVTEQGRLSDDTWNELLERVQGSYGRGLATALARGRIIAEPVTEPHSMVESTSPPVTLVESAATEDVSTDPPEPSAESIPEASAAATHHTDDDALPDDDGLIFDTPAPPVKLTPPWLEPAAVVPSPVVDSPVVVESIPPFVTPAASVISPPAAVFEWPPEPKPASVPVAPAPLIEWVAEAPPPRAPSPPSPTVTAIPETPADPRFDRVTSAVLKLIREERYELAAHLLSTLGDTLPNERCPITAPVLRVAALSRALSYPRGEIAARLEDELQTLAWPLEEARDPEDRLGAGLMLRAACLPAALLGASPTATALLRRFEIEPGTSQLYNFCARVAAFGDRLQGFASELFQTPADGGTWQADEDRLQAEVRDWFGGVATRAQTYARTSPLFVHAHWTVLLRTAQRDAALLEEWAAWQETLATLHRLLQPVLTGQGGERNAVKQDVTKILGWLDASKESTNRGVTDYRTILSQHDRMRETLREGLEFAHRWLRLQSVAPQRAPALPSQAVEELRADLLDRATTVLVELQGLGRGHPGRWVMVGVVAVKGAVEYIRRLCGGQHTLPLREPAAHHVLQAGLLKVPELELDAQWGPQADPAELQRLLLDALNQEELSWRDAFELQSTQGDHLATARLLELPVWRDDDERGVLKQLRSQRLEACRRTIRDELSELMTQVHGAAEQRPELGPEVTEWLRRAEGVLVAIPRQQTFARLRMQVDHLRTAWGRLQAGETRRTIGGPVRLPGDSKVLTGAEGIAPAGGEPTTAWVF